MYLQHQVQTQCPQKPPKFLSSRIIYTQTGSNCLKQSLQEVFSAKALAYGALSCCSEPLEEQAALGSGCSAAQSVGKAYTFSRFPGKYQLAQRQQCKIFKEKHNNSLYVLQTASQPRFGGRSATHAHSAAGSIRTQLAFVCIDAHFQGNNEAMRQCPSATRNAR